MNFHTLCVSLLLTCLATVTQAGASFATRDDVREFIAEMVTQHHFDETELISLFARTQPIPGAIKLVMPPADPGIRSWKEYRRRFVEPKRIAAGKRFMQRHEATLAQAEARYGIPREIIASIIGVETIFGAHMGRFNTFAVLTTLAFDYPPRAALFRKELGELLLLAREEKRDPRVFTGSYAGAIGLPQFLPSSVRAYAIDFDDDHRIDLMTSPADAIGSVARFLSAHGWETGAPIAVTVRASGEGLEGLVTKGIKPQLRPAEFLALGVQLGKVPKGAPKVVQSKHSAGDGGTAKEVSLENMTYPDAPAALIDLISPNAPTEYRLGYQNFYVITRYNRSSFYAAAVMDLATALVAP